MTTTNWDRVQRVFGEDNLARLGRARVGVVGVGSGGGFAALSLAMTGVGHFVLVDDDTIEAHNVVRHVADLRDVGRLKVDAVAELIRQRNPVATITTYPGRVEQYMDALDGLDLIVVGVDAEPVKFVINAWAQEAGVPCVYAGVYERGEGGDAVVIRPGTDGPCYACWAGELRDGLALADVPATAPLDYGMIGEGGTLAAEPGLWLHVVRVASVQADLAVSVLLEGTSAQVDLPGNTVVLANRSLEIIEGVVTPPHSAVWVDVTRDPACLVCGDVVRRARLADTDGGEHLSLDALLGDAPPDQSTTDGAQA